MMVFLYLTTNQYAMLTKSDKSKLRGVIFRHLDGIATATSAFALHKKAVSYTHLTLPTTSRV